MQRINTPDGQFHAGDPSTGALGTIVTQPYMQSLQEEIAGAVESVGLALDPNDNGQLAKAIKAMNSRTAPLTDRGTLNSYAASNAIPLTAQTLVHGVRQRITIGTTNSGASTYSPDGLPPKPIVGMELLPLHGLELLATQIAELEYVVAASLNGGNGVWLLLRCAGGAMQMPEFSYGVTPRQFDSSNTLATMAAVQTSLGSYNGFVSLAASRSVAVGDIGKCMFVSIAGLTLTFLTPSSLGLPAGAAFTIFTSSAGLTLASGSGVSLTTSAGVVASAAMGGGQSMTFVVLNGTTWQAVSSTQGLGSNSDFASSLASSGYQKLPTGLIIQWGVSTFSISGSAVTFPLAFPSGVLALTTGNNVSSNVFTTSLSLSLTGFTGYINTGSSASCYWIALGH